MAAPAARSMCTARKDWQSTRLLKCNKEGLAQIDLSALKSLVELDETHGVLTVEPGLRMGQPTSLLAVRGWSWTIPVVPEILTIGGVICGQGIQSGSVHSGFIGNSALAFELVFSNGEVVNCSRDKNSDLFHSIPWSHGTVAFLTSVQFPLIKAGKYVRLKYYGVESVDEAQKLLQTPGHAFVDGLAFGRSQFVIMHGDMVDEVDVDPQLGPVTVNRINRWYKPFFYLHAKSFVGSKFHPHSEESPLPQATATEYVPLRHYYHRFSRSQMWALPTMFPILGSRLFLVLFGWILPILDIQLPQRFMLRWLQSGGYGKMKVLMNMTEDYLLPMSHLKATLDFVAENTGIFPLWLCPAMVNKEPGMAHAHGLGQDSELYIDLPVLGNVSKEARPFFHPIETVRKFEAFVVEKRGFMATYSDIHLSRSEWRTMFDMSLYDQVRAKHGADDAFPEVYDKVVGNAVRPV